MAKIKPLRQSQLFHQFTDREIAIFSQAVEEIKIDGTGEFLAKPYGLIIIKSGSVQADYSDHSAHLGPGEYFGELSLLSAEISHDPPIRVTPSEPCEVLQVLPERFAELVQKEPDVAFRVVQAVSLSLRERILAHEQAFRRWIGRQGQEDV